MDSAKNWNSFLSIQTTCKKKHSVALSVPKYTFTDQMCSQMVKIVWKYAGLGRLDFHWEQYLSFESIEWLIRSYLKCFLHVVCINAVRTRFLAGLGYWFFRSRGTKTYDTQKAMNSLEEARFLHHCWSDIGQRGTAYLYIATYCYIKETLKK